MADLQVLKALLPDNPLCGISTYKDTLNLATGTSTRQIYKLVLHGTESYGKNVTGTYQYYMAVKPLHKKIPICVCSHLPSVDDYPADVIGVHTTRWANNAVYLNFGEDVMLSQPSGNTVDGLKEYITAQYNAGTPVTIWYIMETATTETIAVPSGLSGTEEGYLNQSGTPIPTNPIYPTANNVEIWQHSLRKLTTSTDTITTLPADVYADGTNATVGLVGNMSQTGTPTPSSPIQPSECGDLETSGTKAGQYKIPIPSASTTTPVYLGEVETTRNVKQIILKGGEINTVDTSVGQALLSISDRCLGVAPISSHYKGKVVTGWNQLSDGECGLLNNGTTIRICDITNVTSAPNYNQWLAQQYAAGTPVCVWYVLSTPQTAVVNEPLRKIGDYADTVSGITIPTITGKDTVDVLTSLKPSEVSLGYTGWHDATVKEWDGSDWQ